LTTRAAPVGRLTVRARDQRLPSVDVDSSARRASTDTQAAYRRPVPGSLVAEGRQHLATLEWINAKDNVCLIGPAGTGKSHLLLGRGHAAVQAGLRVRYLSAATLIETLYRGLADNSVGKVIDTLLRNDLVIVDELGFAPLDATGSQLLFRFVAAVYEHTSLGLASHWPFQDWGRFLPEQSTAVSMLDRLLHHATVVVTEGESFRMREARARTTGSRPTTTGATTRVGTFRGHQWGLLDGH
jgi:DNA replication protein DnaC